MSVLIAAGSIFEAETICCDYCDSVGPCVTVTEPTCCYTGGEEAGVIVALIDYPRFPSTAAAIWDRAEQFATVLRESLNHDSYTIPAPDRTVWFSHRDEIWA
ncbi:hypothetical protein [Sphingomonas sp. PWP1-2]|uniref:hypothetical protein n=1 Tax=Sphingomonas sp. PWP1-2 TaxID=2804558 RepID=UPI003CF5707D